ncbi:hypothetical protein D9613_008889 [Agrocybe pediades]|uniref:Uncharacterized protein n=1 Tax=Agrocybe pediades TaxID=84607 RepID=A0A8H4QV98_9AGAR|nr:hypothetical protein D9613_008889 [Agrocybe pediades]
MFSSLLPNVPSGMKFNQNGPTTKPSNRFSVRVFKTGNLNALQFTYPMGVGPKSESGYRAPQALPVPPPSQREPSNSNWYPARYVHFFSHATILAKMHKPTTAFFQSSSYATSYDQRPRGPATYSIYPSSVNDTYIYEQSTCSKSDLFSNSELDNASTATLTPASAFSPALSTDSTQAIQSTPFPQRLLETSIPSRPTTPALPNGGYAHAPAAPQAATMSRTASKNPQVKSDPVEDHRARVLSLPSRSTTPFRVPMNVPMAPGAPMRMSSTGVIEVPEYDGSTFSEIEVEKRDKIAKINAGINAALTGSFYVSPPRASSEPSASQLNRVASSQPLHPSLHFPPRPVDPPVTAPLSTSRGVYHDSPPKVERVPSKLPDPSPQAGTSSSVPQLPLPKLTDSWSRDATMSSSYRTSSKTSSDITEGGNVQNSRSGYTTAYNTSSAQDGIGPQDRPLPADSLRSQRRSSVVGTRPEVAALRPSSEVRNGSPPRAASDSSHSTHSAQKEYNSRERRDDNHTLKTFDRQPTGKPQRSAKDSSRPQYSSGPLSSSPVQMRPFEEAISGAAYQQQGGIPIADSDKSYNRVRTRSNSFSTSARPNLPLLQQQNQASQPMQASPYDRMTFYEDDSRRARLDSQGAHYMPSSMNSYPTIIPPTIIQLPTSGMDRTISSRPPPTPQDPSPTSRTRGMYEPYIQPPPSQYPRGPPTSYDNIPAVSKYYDAAGNVRTYIPAGSGTIISEPHPQRRYSDGDQNVSVKPPLVARNSAPALRTVRWTENLVCPSPVTPSQRRKGWFNRRGDQLWTNDGAYRSAPAGQEYPPDLDDYPDPGEGWMNEEGIRIDLSHRLIPKAPLRSALKQPRHNTN